MGNNYDGHYQVIYIQQVKMHTVTDVAAFTALLLCQSERSELIAASGELGPDPSSKFFTERTKNIAFVLSINGRWFQINQNYFNQAAYYNDFSGGYKRYYRELPRTFIECPVAQKLLSRFQSTFDIPQGELVLVQVQTSHVYPSDETRCLTGQGIHSDGADKAMLICLQRHNISGARNALYRDPEGEKPVLKPFVLQEGEVLFWEDNRVFHSVEPAQVMPPAIAGSRTVLIAHYPAFHYLSGQANPNNQLTSVADKVVSPVVSSP
ncbi:MAG: 2OG-Fe dioxygenase family protein [Spirulina sp. SIO3F2]|nr:2OG-Fe dioxygenase family protein [Spirulina sp. SIO3F2]